MAIAVVIACVVFGFAAADRWAAGAGVREPAIDWRFVLAVVGLTYLATLVVLRS